MRTRIVPATCSADRCARERNAARVALAIARARADDLARCFGAMSEEGGRGHPGSVADEVAAALQARDWALARLAEWAP